MLRQFVTNSGCGDDVPERAPDHHQIEDEIPTTSATAMPIASLKPRRNTPASTASRTSVIHLVAMQPVRDVRILDDVRGRVSRRQRHRDDEVCCDKSEQDENDELARPPRTALEHRDAALAVRALPGDPRYTGSAPNRVTSTSTIVAIGDRNPAAAARCPADSRASRSSRPRSGTSPATRGASGAASGDGTRSGRPAGRAAATTRTCRGWLPAYSQRSPRARSATYPPPPPPLLKTRPDRRRAQPNGVRERESGRL